MADARRQEELLALQNMMRSPGGRRWLFNALAQARIYATTFDKDALVMAFAEGQRNMGLWLLRECEEAAPELLMQTMREGNVRPNKPDAIRDDTDTLGPSIDG